MRHSKLRRPIRIEDDDAQTSNSTTPPPTQYLLSLAVDNAAGNLTMRSPSQTPQQHPHTFDSAGGHVQRSRSRSPVLDQPAPEQRGAAGDTRVPAGHSSSAAPGDQTSEMLSAAQQRLDTLAANYASTNDQFVIFIQGGTDGVHQTLVLFADDYNRRSSRRPQTHHKDAKLIYYVEEPNMGRGFIKEPCFSNDGRIVCSPFAHGVRLLGFDSDCRQVEDKPLSSITSSSASPAAGGASKAYELQEVASVYSHQNLVVATKYSPTHQLLVTGCLDGQVGFHSPVF